MKSKEDKATYMREWHRQRKLYVPQECLALGCDQIEYRRNHCTVHYKILRAHCDKRFYNIWLNMRARCDNPKNPAYKNYGGRGIAYQPSWAHFINFYIDMYETYNDTLTLDREDNNKGYSNDNCQWATYKMQSNNRRSNRLVTFEGVTKNITQWTEVLAVNKQSVYTRLGRGWSELQALGLEKRNG